MNNIICDWEPLIDKSYLGKYFCFRMDYYSFNYLFSILFI